MAIEIINAIIGLISGCGLSGLIFWRISKKKAKAEARKSEAEADSTEIDNDGKVTDRWMQFANDLKEVLDKRNDAFEKERERAERYYNDMIEMRDDKDRKIRTLQKQVDDLKDDKEDLLEKNHKLELQNFELNTMKCEVKGCAKRIPPSELMM